MIAPLVLSLLAVAAPADLAFMVGDWEGGVGAMKIEERWTDGAGGLMLGTSRTLKEGRAVGFEFLRIEFRTDGVFYVAQPGGRSKTEFRMTASSETSVTFENKDHDHPKVIRYSVAEDGALEAELDGSEGRQSFRFRRVKD